ncbi:3-oxoacyl-ACP synthase, partial [Corynebacterium bovis]
GARCGDPGAHGPWPRRARRRRPHRPRRRHCPRRPDRPRRPRRRHRPRRSCWGTAPSPRP